MRPLFALLVVCLMLAPGGFGAGDAVAAAVQANPHGPGFQVECTLCHTVQGWDELRSPMQFDHDNTRFPLEGRHEQVECGFCHESLEFSQAPTACSECHLDVHSSQFANDCDRCHDPEGGWQNHPQFREMHQETRFPLVGVHAGLDCAACHADGQYAPTPTECVGCHYDSYLATENPSHASAGISTDCAQCHQLGGGDWTQLGPGFAHTEAFPLRGGHGGLECQACHAPGSDFGALSSECYSCHQTDYENADDPDHIAAGFPTDCTVCHTIDDWDDAEAFDHSTTGFALTGAHGQVDCMLCHDQGFAGTPTQCVACHATDRDNADPDHSGAAFVDDCTACHNTQAWAPAPGFDHNTDTDYTLTGAHQSLDCTLCHVNGQYENTPSACFGCHEDDYLDVDDPPHDENGYPTDCEQCHNTTTWEDADFDHGLTEFPLTGEHETLNCNDCHADGFANTAQECFACHEDDFNEAEDPPHSLPSFRECQECHNTTDWEDAEFDHNQTDFPLQGAHVEEDCSECHINGVFDGTPSTCFGCHEADYNDTDDPDHAANNYSHDCTECHNQNDWDDVDDGDFPHGAQTGFEITGAHAETSCSACHETSFSGTPDQCIACHQDDVDAADPPHQPGAFDEDCSLCHGDDQWAGSSFNHDQQTAFAITGEHTDLVCADCHAGGEYLATPETCFGCHEADYLDEHSSGQFPHDCTYCHTTDDWDDADFDHLQQAGFLLTGAHDDASCLACHENQQYEGTPDACLDCHQEEWDNADPVHNPDSFSTTTCVVCHSWDSWTPATFDHDQQTSYDLTGQHELINCSQCHAGGVYQGTATECFACHEDDYNATVDPDHETEGFPTTCDLCHATDGWEGAEFDHALTDFPLTGAHTSVDCALCHVDGYEGTPTACFDCHEDDYDATTEPPHDPAFFGTSCEVCHSTAAWTSTTFDHQDFTGIPLPGAHADLNCTLCHVDGQYSDLPTTCYGCHDDDFDNAQPDHDVQAFGTDCEDCHNTTTWTPSSFNHNQQTDYNLTGAHTTVDCALCHVGGQYTGTPTDCYFCHEADYNQTNDPDHQNAGFPTDCELCHNTSDWDDADFDHVWFPIGPGSEHEQGDEWGACSDCHPNPGDFNVFACTNCHLAGEMNDEHDDVPGYTYDNAACYSCHPNGEGDSLFFPLEIAPDDQGKETR